MLTGIKKCSLEPILQCAKDIGRGIFCLMAVSTLLTFRGNQTYILNIILFSQIIAIKTKMFSFMLLMCIYK